MIPYKLKNAANQAKSLILQNSQLPLIQQFIIHAITSLTQFNFQNFYQQLGTMLRLQDVVQLLQNYLVKRKEIRQYKKREELKMKLRGITSCWIVLM